MSKMNNWMMDIEDFCNGYFYDNHSDGNSFTMKEDDFTIEEVIEDVGMYFKSNEATKYAKQYLTTQMGEM
jgi:hypothetical protein|tara:strand:+ start:441 stop:650 length:210 start_codon:yes stop_codon:yes gene_type:complete